MRHTLVVMLSRPVKEGECTHRVRKGKVYITLKKKDAGPTWPYLTASEQAAADVRRYVFWRSCFFFFLFFTLFFPFPLVYLCVFLFLFVVF